MSLGNEHPLDRPAERIVVVDQQYATVKDRRPRALFRTNGHDTTP
jgi:hypothetical protein